MSSFVELDGRSFHVGQRVCDAEGCRGTVRYIGPVASAKKVSDIWLGIEWDSAARGKHDGSCVDANQVTHRHFSCPPGAGTFSKPTVVRTGRTFTEALLERYVGLDAPRITGAENKLADSFVVTSKGERKAIEFVGEEKIRLRQQLHEVTEVSVRNCEVSSGGSSIDSMCAHLVSVDLQDNLLSSWTDVVDIARQIPRLSSLFLHGNKIGDIDLNLLDSYSGSLNNLKIIALNFCGLQSWSSVKALHAVLPAITELYLAANFFQDISSMSPSFFPFVTTIDLSSCSLSCWRSVAEACGDLQSLEALLLDCNPFESIEKNQDGKFLKLSRLSLATTRLNSWTDVNALSSYPGLASLRLCNIPLFAGKGASELRPEVVARVAQLQVFNGSNISPRERSDSEKIYLRKILRQKRVIEGEERDDAGAASRVGSFEEAHPRFAELDALHGAALLPMGGEGAGSGLPRARDPQAARLPQSRPLEVDGEAVVRAGDAQAAAVREAVQGRGARGDGRGRRHFGLLRRDRWC